MSGDIERYLEYVDRTYDGIVKHLVERKLPLTDERIRLYFTAIIRPYYFWAQEEDRKPEASEKDTKAVDASRTVGEPEKTGSPSAPARKITPAQLSLLKDLRKKLNKKSSDEYLQGLSIDQASMLIDEWKKVKS
jgi:hypothetical protein